ncbi:MAG: hypothetical protein Q8S33_27715 [Myxococcales bacterium]|nr:hypothetical protein [Myxococcales bacterium]
MRRELAIVLGVLVPFAVLLALAFFVFRGAPLPPQPEPDRPLPTRATPPTPARAPPAAVVVVAAPDAGAPAAPPQPLPKELAAPLAAITPEVMLCFRDQRAHQRDVQRLEVRFTPTADGGFAGVKVPSSANPWVSACIEDVFDEMHFAPTGAETFQPAAFTFVFDPSRD